MKNCAPKHSDRERKVWVKNDERLHQWWKSSKKPIRAFIKQNQDDIDEYIIEARDVSFYSEMR